MERLIDARQFCGGDKSTQQKDIAKAHEIAAGWED